MPAPLSCAAGVCLQLLTNPIPLPRHPSRPQVTVQVPDISAFAAEWRQWLNDTSKVLNPAALKVLKPRIPNISVDVNGAEIPQLVVNLPASNVEAGDFIPTIDASQLPTDASGLPTFNVSHLGLPQVQQIVKAFNVHSQLQNMGVPTDPAVINQARTGAPGGGQESGRARIARRSSLLPRRLTLPPNSSPDRGGAHFLLRTPSQPAPSSPPPPLPQQTHTHTNTHRSP
jgi:hypothetical protein